MLAPGALFLFAALSRRELDAFWLSVILAVGTIPGSLPLLGRTIGRRDERLEELSETDALTGLANRRQFDRRLDVELSRTKRYGMTSAVVMVDLDRFKAVNDRFGHRAGDEVLRRVGGLLDSERRAGDFAARYGGEEFIAILLRLDSGVPFHVQVAKQAGATRAEVLSAVLLGLPAVGNAVTQSLPAALAAYDAAGLVGESVASRS